MLKLKYLFDNRELATMLVENWHYDKSSLDLFEYFRISSNAIYPFKSNDKTYFLRFVPAVEKDRFQIEQELKVILLCAQNGFRVPNCLESKSGNIIETKATPWGDYHAVVFECVGDKTLEDVDMNEDIAYAYGKSLAQFHQISKTHIKTNVSRVSVFDILNRLEKEALTTGEASIVLTKQLNQLRDAFGKLKRDENAYGLIHYDYELDNILYEYETKALYAIDFDDCMFGFYGQDIERAINSIESEVDGALQDSIKSQFLNGYADGNENSNLTQYLENRTSFKAFADLYVYFRMRNALEEKWENEPVWMTRLRERLTNRMNQYIAKLR